MNELRTSVSLALIATVLTSHAPSSRADAPPGRYTTVDVSGTPAVKDTMTGLVWMRNELNAFTWENAKAACPAVAAGWRLPNVTELTDLVDEGKASAPTIDTSVFQGRPAGSLPSSTYFWSSSSFAFSAGYAWAVSFDSNGVDPKDVGVVNAVRCVR